MVTSSKRTLNNVIFLLGAGASVDAGMPTVVQLTKELRDRLPEISDLVGIVRPEFAEVFDFLKEHDESIADNYEKFFGEYCLNSSTVAYSPIV